MEYRESIKMHRSHFDLRPSILHPPGLSVSLWLALFGSSLRHGALLLDLRLDGDDQVEVHAVGGDVGADSAAHAAPELEVAQRAVDAGVGLQLDRELALLGGGLVAAVH